MSDNDRPDLFCVGCGKTPSELSEYISAAKEEASGVADMTPDDYVWQEEGTLNRENGHFLCTPCYVKAGMPSSPRGWVAP
jgi:hypothetical protein